MKDIEKRIEINNNRILIYRISEGYSKPTYTILEGFLENGELVKSYNLSQWDDYGLYGWVDNDEDNKLSFEFDINHPLYIPLFHLLNYDDKLLIDDDDTQENDKKYMLIHRKEDKIYIDFINELKNMSHTINKFHIFIKNIAQDGRSKIDQQQLDTKKRLFEFFNEVEDVLVDDYHQGTIEEYLIENSSSEEYKQMKKFFKRRIEVTKTR